MAGAVTFVPEIISEISAVIDGTEYAEAVASVRFTPAQSIQTWKGGKLGSSFTDITTPTYSCAMKIGQDYKKTASLVNYLMAHAGESKACTFKFNSGATIAAQLLLAAPEIGGDIDAWAETTLTHGVQGVPVVTPPAAG